MDKSRVGALIGVVVWVQLACAATRIPESGAYQTPGLPSVPVLEQSQVRSQAAEDGWRLLLNEHGLEFIAPNLDPVLATPLSLPSGIAGRIRLSTRTGEIKGGEMREMMRDFIYNHLALLGGASGDRRLTLQDLTLVRFSEEGNLFRSVYRQMSFPYPVVEGYGEIHLTAGRDSGLLQLYSRMLPVMDYNVRAVVDAKTIISSLINREFEYAGIDGRPLRYRVTRSDEISVGGLVIKPVEDGGRLMLHLAYPVEVGESLKWTVFVDAVTGREIAVRQNFNT
ncbi:MAG: hypothetical protein KF868_07620 [Acidobacteria bacterium]|nr:hypothetical protein [Acidobacteriota bacterium]MCW5967047.1 hypothetical protein [Blastocatellales bacterium]